MATAYFGVPWERRELFPKVVDCGADGRVRLKAVIG